MDVSFAVVPILIACLTRHRASTNWFENCRNTVEKKDTFASTSVAVKIIRGSAESSEDVLEACDSLV